MAWGEANPSSSHYCRLLSSFNQGAEIEVVVIDNEAVEPGMGWLGYRALIEAEVQMVRVLPASEWKTATGRVFIRLPNGYEGKARYGHRLKCSGAFLEPESSVVEGWFRFQKIS